MVEKDELSEILKRNKSKTMKMETLKRRKRFQAFSERTTRKSETLGGMKDSLMMPS